MRKEKNTKYKRSRSNQGDKSENGYARNLINKTCETHRISRVTFLIQSSVQAGKKVSPRLEKIQVATDEIGAQPIERASRDL